MVRDGDLRQTSDRGWGASRRRERRWVWVIVIALPVLLIAAMLLEDSGLPNMTPGYDLSRVVIMWVSGLSALAGIAIIVSGLRRGWRGLHPSRRRSEQWRTAVRRARNRRINAAIVVTIGALIAFFGAAVLTMRLLAA